MIIEKVQEIQGDGGYQYDLPVDWVEGISHIVKLEYPAGKALALGNYSVYKSPSGLKLHFFALIPQVNEVIRIVYTVMEEEKENNDANQDSDS